MNPEGEIIFPPFRLDVANERLWRGSDEVSIRPKAFAVLRYLVESGGRLVTKAELLGAVWRDTHVNPAVPRGYVQELREVLGDDAENPRFIETVRGRGYRFLGSRSEPRRVAAPSFAPMASVRAAAPALVGRSAELAELRSSLERAMGGNRQIVFVTGEPGIGKTALLDVFASHVTEEYGVWLAHGQCLEHHGAGEPYLPVLVALARRCRDSGGRRLIDVLAHFAPTWLAQMPWLIAADERERVERAIATATRERMLREIAEALEALTAETPLVLLLEDLQASDVSTLDLIVFLAERREAARLLIVGTYRPPGQQTGHPLRAITRELAIHRRAELLPLDFLGEEQVAEYLSLRFPGSELSPELPRTIHKRTDGNPLFMVSIVDMLLAAGIVVRSNGRWEIRGDAVQAAFAVPENLRLTIERQIEGVTEEQRQVLEVAAVAGVEFVTIAVAAALEVDPEVVEERLLALATSSQFVRRLTIEEWPDGSVGTRYRFIHSIYQEALYDGVSPTRRVRLHRAIAERQERGRGSAAEEISTELAVHFERARELERTVHYLSVSGDRAIRRHAPHDAIVHLRRALALVETLQKTPARFERELALRITLGGQLIATEGYASIEVERQFAKARELCGRVGRVHDQFPALHGLWLFYGARAEIETSSQLATEIMRLADEAGDPDMLLEAHWMRGCTALLLGELKAAESDLDRAREMYAAVGTSSHAFLYGQDPGTSSTGFLGIVRWVLGHQDRALRIAESAVAAAEGLSHPFTLAGAIGSLALVHHLRRDVAATRERSRQLVELAESHQFAFYVPWGRILHGWAVHEEDETDAGLAEMRTGLSALRAIGAGFFRPYFAALLARALGHAGRAEEGCAVLEESLAEATRTGERLFESELLRFRGELALAAAGGTRAAPKVSESFFRRAIDVARRQGARSFELRAAISLARVLCANGKNAEGQATVSNAYRRLPEKSRTADTREARAIVRVG